MLADDFALFLEQRTNALHSGRHDDPTLFRFITLASLERRETQGDAMPQNSLFSSLRAAYGDHSWSDEERLEIRSGTVKFDVALTRYEDRFEMKFTDDSVFVARPALDPRPAATSERPAEPQAPTLDEGALLLQPITAKELRGAESVLGVLLSASEASGLTKVGRDQIIAMAGMIGAERSETQPDVSSRWCLVGAVQSALKFLAKEPPTEPIAWHKLADILTSIDWRNVARALPNSTHTS